MQHGFCYVPANIYILILLTNTVDATITVWLTSQKNLNFEHAQYGIVEDVGRGSFLFPTYLGRSKETLFAGYSTPRASWKTLTRTFLVPQPEHSVGLRFQTIPVSLQTSNFPGDCRFPDKGFLTAFTDICPFLLSTFSWSSVIFSSINFAFSFIWEQSSSRDFCFSLTATTSISI